MEKLYSKIIQYNADIVIFSIVNYDTLHYPEGNYPKWDLKIDKFEDRILKYQEKKIYILNGCYSSCNKIYRKRFLDMYQDWYFSNMIFYEDMPFHVQVMIRAKRICFTNDVNYRNAL